MSVLRTHKNTNYTVMSNRHLRDKNLSLKAKGLMSMMLSLPDNWNYSVRGLCSICKENQTAINSALKELKNYGYLVVTRITPDKTTSGRMEYVYDLFEEPQEHKIKGTGNDTKTEESYDEEDDSDSEAEEPQVQKGQDIENLVLDNPSQLNKEIINKEIQNTEGLNKDV